MRRNLLISVLVGSLAFLPPVAHAQSLIGPADASRVGKPPTVSRPDRTADKDVGIPSVSASTTVPESAKGIHLVLKAVRVEGSTVFTEEQLSDLYAPYLNQDITLDAVYTIAAAITEHYRAAGYFLSVAKVPEQSIKDGVVTIKVIEGYVGEVELSDSGAAHSVIDKFVAGLVSQKPVTSDAAESFLLRLNDLPGLSFRAVLAPLPEMGEGAVKLTLVPANQKGKGSISFDNFGSRFLGPNEVTASYSTSLLPLQQTTISGLTSLPVDKLNYATLEHSIVLAPNLTFDMSGGVTKANPGFTLEQFDINSHSTSIEASLGYQWIRQRSENLSTKLSLGGRDTSSDLLGVPFTRDAIRAVRASASYDRTDHWRGYNMATVTLSHGIDGLGSSGKGDLNLSRAEAQPDFCKAEVSLTRLQGVTPDWSVLASASGQWASGPLYSAEEFGYGGQGFGRAFDASEITGDHGIAGSLELRYGGWGDLEPVSLQPYAFYDIGAVWNEDTGQTGRDSGASAGFGMRFSTKWQQSGMLGLAFPLTRDIGTPIYGGTSQSPRAMLQISQGL